MGLCWNVDQKNTVLLNFIRSVHSFMNRLTAGKLLCHENSALHFKGVWQIITESAIAWRCRTSGRPGTSYVIDYCYCLKSPNISITTFTLSQIFSFRFTTGTQSFKQFEKRIKMLHVIKSTLIDFYSDTSLSPLYSRPSKIVNGKQNIDNVFVKEPSRDFDVNLSWHKPMFLLIFSICV